VKILLWHVHGGWAESFVRGPHEYLFPTRPEGGPWGLGRGGRNWPASAREIAGTDLATTDVDVVVLQRFEEIAVSEALLRRKLGRDVPAIYVEHNTPKGSVPDSRHALADRTDIHIAHVTHFNSLMWDTGAAPTGVIEHGVPDPGPRYTGVVPAIAAVINEPVRRWRVTGTDLLPAFAAVAPLHVFGMAGEHLGESLSLDRRALQHFGEHSAESLHDEMAKRRLYLHPFRWTSLGLTLLEAMHLAMPVLALATTEATRAVPAEAGAISHSVDELARAARMLMDDPAEARRRGQIARDFALDRFSLATFLERWNTLLEDVVEFHLRAHRRTPHPSIGAAPPRSHEERIGR
jgi:hypothetical protein